MKIFSLSSLATITGCLLVISGAHAQTNTANSPAAPDYGMLGKSYFAFDADLIKYRNSPSSPTGLGSDLTLNVEASDNLDVGFAYDFSHAQNTAWRTTDNIGRINTTGFVKFAHVAPFVNAGLGYGWEHSSQAKGTPIEGKIFHRALYDLGTGVEIPLIAQTSMRLGVGYEESFRKPHPKDMSYQLALNYQLDDTFCTNIGANLQDGHNGSRDAVVYHAGIRIIFD